MALMDPHIEHLGTEANSAANVEDTEQSLILPPLPHPTPIDLNNMFLGRKSTSHARRQNPGHIPRPRNAFILFRCDFVQQHVPNDVISDHRDLSRLAGSMWRKMTDEQKRPWFKNAEAEKRYHSQLFPTYRYAPGPGNRPKRVYRRKKLPVPDEVLLKDRHHTERRAISCPAATERPPQVQTRSSPAPQVANDDIVQNLQYVHPGYRPYQSMKFSEDNRSFSILDCRDPSSSSLATPLRGGFIQIPMQNELFNWEAPLLESSPYNEQGLWLPATSEVSQDEPILVYVFDSLIRHGLQVPVPEPAYYYAGYSLPTNVLAQGRSTDSLYNMWEDLQAFHDQSHHQRSLYLYSDPQSHAASASQEAPYTPTSASSLDEVCGIYSVSTNSPAHSPS